MAPAVNIIIEALDDLNDEDYKTKGKPDDDNPGDDVDQEFQQEFHNQRGSGKMNNTQYNRNNCMVAGTRGQFSNHAEL